VALRDDLILRRTAAREAADAILTRAAEDPAGPRDLTPDELAEHRAQVVAEREAADALEAEHDRELAELRAASTRRQDRAALPREPVLTREQSVYDWCQQRGMFDPADEALSFDRYLRGIVTGDWQGAEHERALSEGTLTAGGHLVPTPLSARVIDLARNQTRVFQAGAITVPMTAATLKLARLTGENAPAWKSENAAITDQDMTFDSVTFTARTMVRLIKLSLELFEDSDPSAEDVIARSFAGQVALELDRVALRGSGTPPEPQGVRNQTGVTITTHGANGALIATATAYDWHLDARGVVTGNNFTPNAHIQAPRTSTSLSKLREATTSAYLAPPPGMLPMLATKQVPINLTVGTSTDTSEIYTADWSQLMVGIRNDFRLIPLKERYMADNLQVAFLAYMRADIQLAQPSAFVVDTGIRT
jgi:HK97 family phage major capsid protein